MVMGKRQALETVMSDVAGNLGAWQDWSNKGYAKAFDEAWDMGITEPNDIASYVIHVVGSTKNRVNENLMRTGAHAEIDEKYSTDWNNR